MAEPAWTDNNGVAWGDPEPFGANIDLLSIDQVDQLLQGLAQAGTGVHQLVPVRAHVRVMDEPPDCSISVDVDGDIWYRDGASMSIVAYRDGRGAGWSRPVEDCGEFAPYLVIWPLVPPEVKE